MRQFKIYFLVFVLSIFTACGGGGSTGGADPAVVKKDQPTTKVDNKNSNEEDDEDNGEEEEINNAPEFSNLTTTYNINENQLTVVDFDVSDSNNDSLTIKLSGTDASFFNIDTTNYILSFKTNPDYESQKHQYSINISVSDGSESISKDLTINLLNVDDVVPVLADTNLTIDENLAADTIMGSIIVTDEGDSNITSYTIETNDYFTIESNGSVKNKVKLNYEDTSEFNLSVTATNGAGNSNAINLNIKVNDIVEIGNPTDINITSNLIEYDTNLSIDENTGNNFLVGVFSADGNGTQIFTLENNGTFTDNTLFDINDSNKLYLKSNANYENKQSYLINVRVDNGNITLDQNFTIFINDMNDVAQFETNSTTSVFQNSSYHYVANITDEDATQTLTILTHTIPTGFEVNATDGNNTNDINISVTDLGALGDSMVGDHDFTLNVRENNTSNTISQSYTLTVQDVNDAPTYDGNTSDKTINFGGNNVFSFTLDDGDHVPTQTIIANVQSSNLAVATISTNDTSFTDGESLQITVIGGDVGESNITVVLEDNGGIANGGDNNSSFSFKVIIRSNGLKLYSERKEAGNDTEHNVTLDNIIYTWDTTNRWYATTNTILMPVKILSDADLEANNFNKKADGHYDVNKSDYINENRKTGAYTDNDANNNFVAADGVTLFDRVENNTFNHDPVHNLFVSKIVTDIESSVETLNYTQWTDTNSSDSNGTNFGNIVDSNETYTTDINMSISYESSSLEIDYNNDGNITDSYCAQIYGSGWRLPTSYEVGMDVERGTLSGDGYIPSYLGTAGEIFTSTFFDNISGNDYLWTFKVFNGATNFKVATDGIQAKCVYLP